MNTETLPAKVDPLRKLLEFTREHEGVVLFDWASKPQTQKVCRVIFPTKLRRADLQGGASEFAKMCINYFYPEIEAEMTGTHRVTVLLDNGRKVELLESDLERRRLMLGGSKLEYPTYAKARSKASVWPFLGVDGILLERPV